MPLYARIFYISLCAGVNTRTTTSYENEEPKVQKVKRKQRDKGPFMATTLVRKMLNNLEDTHNDEFVKEINQIQSEMQEQMLMIEILSDHLNTTKRRQQTIDQHKQERAQDNERQRELNKHEMEQLQGHHRQEQLKQEMEHQKDLYRQGMEHQKDLHRQEMEYQKDLHRQEIEQQYRQEQFKQSIERQNDLHKYEIEHLRGHHRQELLKQEMEHTKDLHRQEMEHKKDLHRQEIEQLRICHKHELELQKQQFQGKVMEENKKQQQELHKQKLEKEQNELVQEKYTIPDNSEEVHLALVYLKTVNVVTCITLLYLCTIYLTFRYSQQ